MGKLTSLRFKAKVINNDPLTNPTNGWVEGFYYQDLDNGVLKHYIFNCPNTWEVDPGTLKIARSKELPTYNNPVTTIDNIKELQERLVQTTIDYIKENNLTDIYDVSFSVDGLEGNAIEFGEWTPCMDSSISVEGLQDEGDGYRSRALIGEYF
jgi:hypothetical protein